MNDVKISKAIDRYSCNLCKSHTANNLYEITIGSINICLCSDCFRKTRAKMNDVLIDGYKEPIKNDLVRLQEIKEIIKRWEDGTIEEKDSVYAFHKNT